MNPDDYLFIGLDWEESAWIFPTKPGWNISPDQVPGAVKIEQPGVAAILSYLISPGQHLALPVKEEDVYLFPIFRHEGV